MLNVVQELAAQNFAICLSLFIILIRITVKYAVVKDLPPSDGTTNELHSCMIESVLHYFYHTCT